MGFKNTARKTLQYRLDDEPTAEGGTHVTWFLAGSGHAGLRTSFCARPDHKPTATDSGASTQSTCDPRRGRCSSTPRSC